jgi:hypothetical protein
MARTAYDPSNPNHRATCQRSTCAEREPHPGGRHLDQRDELYDGPGSLLQVLPPSVRDSARKIIREAPELMPEVVDLGNEIEFLRGQVAAVRVDADRRERAAMLRSADCEHHGREIEELGRRLGAVDRAGEKTEKARLALLGFMHAVDDLVRAYREGRTDPGLSVAELVDALAKASKKASDAHARAWSV